MTDKQFLQLQKALTDVVNATIEAKIETKVNGGIRHLDEKIDNYIKADIAWKETDKQWKATAQPVVSLGQDALGAGRALKWVIGIVIGVYTVFKFFTKQ